MAGQYELLKNLTTAAAGTRSFLVRVVNPDIIEYTCWLRRIMLFVFACGGIEVLV